MFGQINMNGINFNNNLGGMPMINNKCIGMNNGMNNNFMMDNNIGRIDGNVIGGDFNNAMGINNNMLMNNNMPMNNNMNMNYNNMLMNNNMPMNNNMNMNYNNMLMNNNMFMNNMAMNNNFGMNNMAMNNNLGMNNNMNNNMGMFNNIQKNNNIKMNNKFRNNNIGNNNNINNINNQNMLMQDLFNQIKSLEDHYEMQKKVANFIKFSKYVNPKIQPLPFFSQSTAEEKNINSFDNEIINVIFVMLKGNKHSKLYNKNKKIHDMLKDFVTSFGLNEKSLERIQFLYNATLLNKLPKDMTLSKFHINNNSKINVIDMFDVIGAK